LLLSQINGHIRTETSQYGGIEKIDSVKAVQARTRWRGFSSIEQCHNGRHLLNVLSHRKPGAAARGGDPEGGTTIARPQRRLFPLQHGCGREHDPHRERQ